MKTAPSNLDRAAAVLRFCIERGVSEFVICAGARNAPLVELLVELLPALAANNQLRSWSFFEERSAAFFALGRTVRTQNPIAVLTTSGTAAAELLPATIEAYYQGRPLVLITADRPTTYRGTGSPQSMDQVGLFGPHVEKSVDIESDSLVLQQIQWSGHLPLHLNVCFEEPQSHRPSTEQTLAAVGQLAHFTASLPMASNRPTEVSKNLADFSAVQGALAKIQNPLIIVGPIRAEDRRAALKLLNHLPGAVYAESLSGLTAEPSLHERLIFSDEIAALALTGTPTSKMKSFCDAVIRIGSVPTCRLWRDLETVQARLPVINFVPHHAAWPGLARKDKVWTLPWDRFLNASTFPLSSANVLPPVMALKQMSAAAHVAFAKLLADFPRSEMALVHQLAFKASEPKTRQRVYLGNSLAVREWDSVSYRRGYHDIYGHRGVNGIDGQVSSFLAWSCAASGQSPHSQVGDLAVIGDLTAMYDLAALAFTPQLESGRRTLTVINNGGGMIFQKIFLHELFLNRHNFNFEAWAQMFGWSYLSATRQEGLRFAEPSENLILEIKPDANESDAFQKRWKDWILKELGQ